MAVIYRELKRGRDITDMILMSKRPWGDLFVKHSFFTNDYKYYLAVIATSTSKEAHKIWSGFVESKVRLLVQKLDQHGSIALAHPFVKGYERTHKCMGESEVHEVQEGSLTYRVTEPDDQELCKPDGDDTLKPHEDQTEEVLDPKIYTTTHYVGLELSPGKYCRVSPDESFLHENSNCLGERSY
jgi:poly(A) polymerase